MNINTDDRETETETTFLELENPNGKIRDHFESNNTPQQ